jgi:hypothetical protein
VGIDIPGEQRFVDKVFEALDAELAARDFKCCISME